MRLFVHGAEYLLTDVFLKSEFILSHGRQYNGGAQLIPEGGFSGRRNGHFLTSSF
jgi:hypothetical protein